MDIRFDCTMCGKCCHNLNLPISVDEAISWLKRGGAVKIFCEAIPWPEEPTADDVEAQYRRARSFAATSGALPARIMTTLVAAFEGACPFLAEDMRCGAYAERPRVCRIYPAEINPFAVLTPERKACPSEAWADDQPWLLRDDKVVDTVTADLITASRAAAVADTDAKKALCAILGIDRAALANEGFVIHAPAPDRLLAALEAVRAGAAPDATGWQVLSNRTGTVAMLADAGAIGALADPEEATAGEYLGFFPAS